MTAKGKKEENVIGTRGSTKISEVSGQSVWIKREHSEQPTRVIWGMETQYVDDFKLVCLNALGIASQPDLIRLVDSNGDNISANLTRDQLESTHVNTYAKPYSVVMKMWERIPNTHTSLERSDLHSSAHSGPSIGLQSLAQVGTSVVAKRGSGLVVDSGGYGLGAGAEGVWRGGSAELLPPGQSRTVPAKRRAEELPTPTHNLPGAKRHKTTVVSSAEVSVCTPASAAPTPPPHYTPNPDNCGKCGKYNPLAKRKSSFCVKCSGMRFCGEVVVCDDGVRLLYSEIHHLAPLVAHLCCN